MNKIWARIAGLIFFGFLLSACVALAVLAREDEDQGDMEDFLIHAGV